MLTFHVLFPFVNEECVTSRFPILVGDDSDSFQRSVDFEFSSEVVLGAGERQSTDEQGFVRISSNFLVFCWVVCRPRYISTITVTLRSRCERTSFDSLLELESTSFALLLILDLPGFFSEQDDDALGVCFCTGALLDLLRFRLRLFFPNASESFGNGEGSEAVREGAQGNVWIASEWLQVGQRWTRRKEFEQVWRKEMSLQRGD